MNGQQYAEKASAQFLLQPKPVFFAPVCTFSPAPPYSCVRLQIPTVMALYLFPAWVLSPAAGSQCRREQRNKVADWGPREEVGGNRLSFLYSNFRSLPHLSAQSTRNKSTSVMLGIKTVLGPGLAYAYQWAMPILTDYLLLVTVLLWNACNSIQKHFMVFI